MRSSDFVWSPPLQAALPIHGSSARAPVRRIFCVARNYHAHAVEMGSPVDKNTMHPVYFLKDSSALVASGATIPYPPATDNFHYEMELVVLIGKPGFRVSVADASELVFGYAAGLDMTRRDLQLAARHDGRPWDVGKNFEHSAVCSAILPATAAALSPTTSIRLQLNDETRQDSTLDHMIWSVDELIADLSTLYHLQPGDLIFTGTPEGVGMVKPGDRIRGEVESVAEVVVEIGPAE